MSLKSIPIADLRVGMYIHDLGVSWLKHDFVVGRFLIETADELKRVRGTGTREVVIDLSRSRLAEPKSSVPPVLPPGAGEGGASALAAASGAMSASEATSRAAQTRASKPGVRRGAQVSLDEELGVARRLHSRARSAIASTMADARAGRIARVDEVREIADGMVESISRNAAALTSLAGLKTKDDYTFMHCVAVGTFMIALGQQMGLDDNTLRDLGLAGLMHDVGKMIIPDEILNKPGKLTDQEFMVVRNHPMGGHDLLRRSGFAHDITLDVVLHHHERIDGSGYPERLSGEQLSLAARMGAVTDVYDAVTSIRVYHKAMRPTAALRMMLGAAGTHFDPVMVKAFIKCVGIYPNGSLVRLQSGRLAVVLEQHESQTLTPRVKTIYSTRSQMPITPEIIDLSRHADTIVSDEDPASWGLDLSLFSEFVSPQA